MVRHPHIQHRAQAEIDAVVGTERIPTIEDRHNLPFVESIMKETLRCFPSVPLGQ